MRVIRVTTAMHMVAALALRHEVFVVEQKVSPEGEHDMLDEDPTTVHVLALTDDAVDESAPTPEEVLSTGRLVAPGGDGRSHIGRVAVAAPARGQGIGGAVMEALEAFALDLYGPGPVEVALSAQVQAIPFYEARGYTVRGEPYLDEGIWHRQATKRLDPPTGN